MLAQGSLVSSALVALPGSGATFNDAITEAAAAIAAEAATVVFISDITEVVTAAESCDATIALTGSGAQRVVRDCWDRDEWGNFIPSAAIRFN